MSEKNILEKGEDVSRKVQDAERSYNNAKHKVNSTFYTFKRIYNEIMKVVNFFSK